MLPLNKIAWCTGHYETSFTKEKARELRGQGYKVSFNNYIKESGKSYCKIYLERDLNYHLLSVFKDIESLIKHKKIDVVQASKEVKKDIQKICKTFHKPIRLEYCPIDQELFFFSDGVELINYDL